MRWVSFSFLVPLTALTVMCGLTVTTAASAQSARAQVNCPPGSWFCESVEVEVGGPDAKGDQPAAPEEELAATPDDSPKTVRKKRPRPRMRPRPIEDDGEMVAVDPDEGETVIIVKKKRHRRAVVAEGVAEKARLKKQRRWRERFGLNLRIEAAAFIPREGDEVHAIGGAGASFRWRPSPYFAFDLGGDIVGGSDYNGDDRVEFSGALSGILYFNPQHRVQVYGIGGVHLAHAEVERKNTITRGCVDCNMWQDESQGRNYFGGHGGLGVEFRISRHFGMFLDGLAIIRTRIDSDEPEFRDPNTGETTNTSGAGLFRTGVNFWW